MAMLASAPASIVVPALRGERDWLERAGSAFPFACSLFLASAILWAPLNRYTAFVLAVSLTGFFGYWLLRSYAVAIACMVGLRRIRRWERTDWHARFDAWSATHPSEPWNWPRHVVIIPNYREPEEGLRRTLDSLAAQANAEQVVVVLAMEEREAGAERKATRLLLEYRERFADLFASYHPAGLPGEVAGKGSNEAWAARATFERLRLDVGRSLRRYTITSCDADAVFHPQHFSALNYLFLTASDRYRTFWQPAIFNSNNIWEVPAPLRIPDGLSGINRLANMVLPPSVKFPTSCYSLSWELLQAVDYWDEEVIPEDWHVYLKACFTLGDRVHVESLYLPLGNDCVRMDGTLATMRAHYRQAVRHAWGASDIPYAWRALATGRTLSWRRGLLLASTLTKVHVLWAAQWYIVTLGVLLPAKLAGTFDAPMPQWWTHRYYVPGPGWHPEHVVDPARWLAFDSTGLMEPRMGLNVCGLLIAVCIVPLLVLIVLELRMRGQRPSYVSRWAYVSQLAMWPLMAPITFVWASLPAFHAQWRLASGRGLVYRVAEKGSRAFVQQAAPVEPLAPPDEEPPHELEPAAVAVPVRERNALAASSSLSGNLLIL
ncbi:MAG: hypothetical protein FJ035_05540 [Chloroflexi bacterium]|nr:hypothetical protein [Chloroflexota bacterium]